MDIKKDHINFAVGPVQISEEIARIGACIIYTSDAADE